MALKTFDKLEILQVLEIKEVCANRSVSFE